MGAIFGLAGIFAAACLYLFYALVKLVFLLATLTAQLIFAISGLIARAIIYTYYQIRDRNATPPAASSRTNPFIASASLITGRCTACCAARSRHSAIAACSSKSDSSNHSPIPR